MNTPYKVFALLGLFFLAGAFFLVSDTNSIFAEEVSFGEVEERVPSTTTSPSVGQAASGKNTIFFFGDIMLARDVERRMNQAGGMYPFAYTVIPTSSAYAVANFESAVPKVHIPTPNNTFRFSTKREYLPALKAAGFTHMSLANNHTFDAGLPGYNNTVAELWQNDIEPFGHPTVVSSSSVTFIELEGVKVAVVAIHTLFTEPSRTATAAVLAHAASLSDKQVVYIHWGEEYMSLQSAAQREYATFLIKSGADMVVGHHPHVVQGVELIEGVPVFYSLGNYIFDQYFSQEVQEGLVLSLSYKDRLQVALLPVTSVDSRTQPRPMEEAESVEFFKKIATLSSPELSEQILAGLVIF